MLGRILLWLALALAAPAHPRGDDRAPTSAGQRLVGKVVEVKDGDSIVIMESRMRRRIEVRLAGIDAPEIGQPWGQEARSALRRRVDGREVRVSVTDRDRYGRTVGLVRLGRLDVNAWLVREGHAWAVARYHDDPAIRAAHREARAAERGLWALPPGDRMPPAAWRARNPRVRPD